MVSNTIFIGRVGSLWTRTDDEFSKLPHTLAWRRFYHGADLWRASKNAAYLSIIRILGERLEYEEVIGPVRRWVESLVVGLNLCPFAKRELVKNRVRYSVTEAATEEQLLLDLQVELELLNRDDAIETTLLIHPGVLKEFCDYNQFLDSADGLLTQMRLNGVYQIASFHPDYQFGGTAPEDAENYTNRSPYPLLHLIREESLERAISNYPDSDQIPGRNIELLDSLGRDKMRALLHACFNATEK